MANMNRGQTFGATESITNTKLHALVDSGSVSGITNADCDSAMALVNSKLANLVDAGKVSGSSLYNLASVPSGAGLITATSLLAAFPVGSIYINITGTNPGTFLGGTWVAFGSGTVLVGQKSSDTDFDVAEETGGAKTINITHTHTVANGDEELDGSGGGTHVASSIGPVTSSSSLSSTQSIMNPYTVVYFWKRTV